MGALSFLLNGKVLMIIAIVAVLGFGYYKWTSLQSQAKEVAEQLVIEKKNTDTLRANVAIIEATNVENQRSIDRLQIEKREAEQAAKNLRDSVAATNRKLDDAKQKLAAITAPPTPLSPYLISAIESIQESRAQVPRSPASAPVLVIPNLPASAPATSASAPKPQPKSPIKRVIIP